jgi:hypothetical protein
MNDETKPREEQVEIALFVENDVRKKREHLSDCLYALAVIDITRALFPKITEQLKGQKDLPRIGVY